MVSPPPPGGFVPLTNLPGLPDDTGKRALADYLNVLFRLAIGIGALIAVIKITYAGIQYMGTDAFSSKEQAKKDITSALLGLLIMLSTVVILQLIYPDILNINVLQKLEPIKVSEPTSAASAGTMTDVPASELADRAAAAAKRGETVLESKDVENTTLGIDTDREIAAFKQRCDARSGRTERTTIRGPRLGGAITGVTHYRMICYGIAGPAPLPPGE